MRDVEITVFLAPRIILPMEVWHLKGDKLQFEIKAILDKCLNIVLPSVFSVELVEVVILFVAVVVEGVARPLH